MTFASEIICARCDRRFRCNEILNLCSCGSPLLVQYDLPKLKQAIKPSDLAPRSPTLWRYREFLPLCDDANIVSLGEGLTPLIEAAALARDLKLKKLWIKDESRNPTGSFKDRGLCLAVSMAKELGIKKLAIPSAGNEGLFFCPEGAATVAALRRLVAQRWIRSEEEVVIFNTASGLKYLDVI
jgi:threonine synthase